MCEHVPVRFLQWVVAAVVGCVVVSGCGPTNTPKPPVLISDPVPHYQRSYFGASWPRIHGTCDLKEVLLERDSSTPVDSDGDGCRDDGPVIDPYVGDTVPASETEPDHVMSLEDAWVSGAWAWPPAQRRIFFTDQGNLLTTRNRVNESKGGRGPDVWEPPIQGQCVYAKVYAATVARWGLVITVAKRDGLTRMLGTCRDTP